MKTTENTNEITIYAVKEIIKLSKMFEESTGGELQSVTLQNTDLKFIKKDLGIHDSDISYNHSNDNSNIIAFVMNTTDEKYHLMWFKLDNYVAKDFDSWKMIKETTEYK